jgi:hypothetical protein
MRLPMSAALATLVATVVVSATPAAAIERPATPAGTELVTRIADVGAPYRRSARTYRHRRSGYWRVRPLVITAGHPLHYFPGEIVYTYFPADCCCCRGR